jgi:fibronectin-binding autotransporter adhesin
MKHQRSKHSRQWSGHKNKSQKVLYRRVAFVLIPPLLAAAAYSPASNAQNVTVSGSNGLLQNGCLAVTSIPRSCATESISSLGNINSSTWESTPGTRLDVAIGANLSNSNSGPVASGTIRITNGGIATTHYMYLGFEKNTTGTADISGAGSEWIAESAGVVGHYGNGTLRILDGGLFDSISTDYFYVGYGDTGIGNVTVSGVDTANGTRSSLISRNRIYVGNAGNGTLNVLDGAYASSEYTMLVGALQSGSGLINVTGVHAASGNRSTLKIVNNHLWLGGLGKGILQVKDGGLVDINNQLVVGQDTTGTGTVHVSGTNHDSGLRSTINADSVVIGSASRGEMNVTNGGLVNSPTFVWLGGNTGTGVMNIDGIDATTNTPSTVQTNGTAYIGWPGKGTLNLSNGGIFRSSDIKLANAATASATLNIGTGAKAGILDTSHIEGGTGNAIINFNHTDDITFTPLMIGKLNVNQINSGTTTLMATNRHTGITSILAGTLKAGAADVFSSRSDYVLGKTGIMHLNDFVQTIQSVRNGGDIYLGSRTGTVLNVVNNYVGDGGTINLNTALNGDTSASDRLVIAGNTSGDSKVQVKNIGGTGAQTVEGIRIIEVAGASNGNFRLQGDYVFHGEQAVVAGAYAYRLYKNGISTPNDGAWYLRSSLRDTGNDTGPLYQPGVPVYEAYAQSLLALNGLDTLQQRVGDRAWTQDSTVAAPAAGPVTGNGAWARIDASRSSITPGRSTSGSIYDISSGQIQTGLDATLTDNTTGSLVAGLNARYGNSTADISAIHGNGYIKTDAYGIGATLTWYDASGLYLDGQAQASWYNSVLSSDTARRNLIAGNKGYGYTYSLETGKRLPIAQTWSATPQAQLIYSRVKFDPFSDTFGARVTLSDGASLKARLGLSFDCREQSLDTRTHLYGITNLYYEFLDGTRATVSGTSLINAQEKLWGGLGMGGVYSWGNGKYTIYGEGLVNTSLQHWGNSYIYQGRFGFRMKW